MIDVDGSIVESMIQSGRQIILDAVEEFKPIKIIAAYLAVAMTRLCRRISL